MAVLGKLLCCNRAYATPEWRCDHFPGISRLYFVHEGSGGCIHNGRKYEFHPGTLYFIPYSSDYEPFCDPDDPILHTYADFERMPPLITDRILSADPEQDPRANAALQIFCLGAGEPEESLEMTALCTESILYLSAFAARKNGVAELTDPTVLKILTRIHETVACPRSVASLAEENYLSKDALIRKFKRALGVTPYAYAKNLRLAKARRLRQEGWSLESIARETGYTDASALAHALKRQSNGKAVDFEQKPADSKQ